MDWLVFKTFLSMLLIVGLMFGLLFVVRKYFFGKTHFVNDNLRVITALNLQPKKAIYLVKVFGKVILVGVSDNSISSLGEIDDADVLQKIEASTAVPKGNGFAEMLKGLSLR